ncbi:hypothetical protein [Nocardioides mangrovi]|uniref:DUF3558 domain-containing protein n=1 Tax=Nocardioides mangrovi TaxID=2874580 RepID=A0ABS7U9E6_9ACTN|nr:hypothetical protein [Nocardioides mangrovi]MBZ5737482.1 hypothetical protein [Nocardioides mangrovi]
MPPVSRLTTVAALGAVALLVALGLGGCDDGDSGPTSAPTPSSTPLDDFDSSGLVVGRTGFCARVAPAAVEEALGGSVTDSRTWSNGDRAEVEPGVTDVVHEYGCSWTSDGGEARAWVFAPPVTIRQARVLARSAAGQRGCTTIADAPAYGAPTAAVRCRADGAVTTSFHGLFGDAWLSCSLTTQDRSAAILERAGRWCVTVAQASS